MTINDNYPAATFITLPICSNAIEWKTQSACKSVYPPNFSLSLALSLSASQSCIVLCVMDE